MERFLLVSHVLGGGTVLFLGILNMLNRKGGKNHILLGKIYVGSMWWICLSAMSITTFYRFSAFLMVIAVLTFYSSFVGVRVLKRKKPGTEKWLDWMVAILTCLFGLGLAFYGLHLYLNSTNHILALLCGIFGLFTFNSAFQDIRFFRSRSIPEKKWWLLQHINAMGGSYIAAVTAFAVQNPNLFMPNSSNQWLLWVLPGVIGGFVISIVIRKWRRKIQTA